MGQITLAGFRSRLLFNLGDRDIGVGPPNNWINDGYFELIGSHDFKELKTAATLTVLSGATGTAIPPDALWMKSLYNQTDRQQLIEVDVERYHSLLSDDSEDDEGDPVYWCRDGSNLRFFPPLDEDKKMRVVYTLEPDRLTADDDVTVLPGMWDRGVLMFGTYHALLDLGEELRATEWLARSMTFIRSRLTTEEMEDRAGIYEGVRYITKRSQLRSLNDG